MILGQVIGKVTLNRREASLKGGRFLLVQPLSREQLDGAPLETLARGNTAVVYDNLGAGPGDLIGFSEYGEAAAAFTEPTPVDAFNCMLINQVNYQPPKAKK